MTRQRPPIAIDVSPPGADDGGSPQRMSREIEFRLGHRVQAMADRPPPRIARLRHLDLQQLAALEVRGQPTRLHNPLSHPQWVFVFSLVEGDCLLTCDDRSLRLRSGQFTVLRGDRVLQVAHEAPYLVRGTRLLAAPMRRELACWEEGELLALDGTQGAGALLMALQDCLLSHGEALGPRSADVFAHHLACVMADVLRQAQPEGVPGPNSQSDHHRRRIRAFVRQHLDDPALDAAGIAAGVGLSVAHLHRLFAGEPLSLRAWVQAERLDGCRDALAAGATRSLTELALRWGFRDPAHFSRSFKRRFGVSPSALRGGQPAPGAGGE